MILSSLYFPPIIYFHFLKNNEVEMDYHENFIKQTYRNRCTILGPNGKHKLIVPLKKRNNHCPMAQVEIDYSESWQKQHFRSLKTAYNNSPYFEFYEDLMEDLILNHEENNLVVYNTFLTKSICKILKIIPKINPSTAFSPYQEKDWRLEISPKKDLSAIEIPKYMQVFSDKFDFVPHLSILDLLFNLGPKANDYLDSINLKNS